MAFKIKHIATRFLVQSIFTILIIATLIFVMFYSGYRKNDTLKAVSAAEEIKTNLTLLSLNLDKAFNLQKADPEFVNTSCDELLVFHESIIKNIVDSLETIFEIHYLMPYFKETKKKDSLNLWIREYSISYSKTLLSIKEKGNTTGGLVKIAAENIQKVMDELTNAPDQGLQAANFKGYTSAYLTGYSYSQLFALINFCEELVTPFYYFDDYDVSELESRVNELKTILKRIEQVDLRLEDPSNKTGQIPDVEEAYTKLNEQFKGFRKDISEQSVNYVRWWNWTFTILAMLLTAAYIIVMARFSGIVRRSIKALHKITVSLSEGSIKDTVPERGYYEFEAFNKDFKSLFALLNGRKDFINDLLKEEFETKLEIKDENDKIGNALLSLQKKMNAAKQEQIKYDEENSSRRYINEGLARFAEVMRINSNNTNQLADEFIKEIVKYMGALQGVLFLTENNKDDNIYLASAFAYDRKRYLEKTIKIGEGLVGTCAIEQKTINLTEIPHNYVLIKSGLGDTPPNNILLLPVSNDGELVGVIEIASLKIFTEQEIELAENIASSLASTIITSRTNLKTAELLKKSQEQAAEMAEQEEEMRQNMEELKATQEESARREEEMQGLLDSIGKSFHVLEYNTSAKILHANDRLIEFIEQSVEQVLNRKHQEIFSDESQITSDLIEEIISKKVPVSIEEVLNWGTKKYQYKYNLSPVYAGNGEVIKVLNLFTIDEVEVEDEG